MDLTAVIYRIDDNHSAQLQVERGQRSSDLVRGYPGRPISGESRGKQGLFRYVDGQAHSTQMQGNFAGQGALAGPRQS